MSEFPPIADYAFLSDCQTSALVAPDGSVEWMCIPRPDSPSVFGALLDRSAGSFQLGPTHAQVPSQRRYLPGSMVLETTWCLPTGTLVVRDALVMGPWNGTTRSDEYRRPPADHVAQDMLVRTAACIEGSVEITVNCMPLFEYGRSTGSWAYAGEGYESATCSAGELTLTLTSNLRLTFGAARAGARTELSAGETAFVALCWDGHSVASVGEATELLDGTDRMWRDWIRKGNFPDHRWRPHLERSALTLKGLTYAPSGALMAAATTSLPETPGGERNWDYRYTWVRDSAFMLRALFELGYDWVAFEYFAFLIDAVASGPLQIMYGLDGERDLTERTLDHLAGYDGARPVRVGNGAWNQRQHDMWGMLIESVATHVKHASQLGPPAWALVTQLVDGAIDVYPKPDRGIWEVRGEPRHFTASKVMCWVAADRGAIMAADRGQTELAQRWRQAADEIHADVCANGVDDRGVFVQHYDTTALDAATLLIPIMGFLPPDDDRVRATVLAIADELTADGLVLRYRTEETDDGLSGVEGTFTICSFWLVSALALIGEVDRARMLCEKLLSFASPLHLYAEEIESSSGRHLGNFPQAFTHLALIDAVTSVIKAGG
ncbi:Glucoamylase (glucan-1,4-alpha-glucosidase), GH15 family [Rhodococcus maanshanensis]|uniref:Trehalase n=2 Tax=Rhodococcus maanshanensis TaxID=183556 RepID=A0A1H7RHS8_9NOCA|nr:Glucoamylase (glucan-1,4-alpha-glucosidase), GH15 family [Rhodococcus maanshanensis]